jgi:hypothetical protein
VYLHTAHSLLRHSTRPYLITAIVALVPATYRRAPPKKTATHSSRIVSSQVACTPKHERPSDKPGRSFNYFTQINVCDVDVESRKPVLSKHHHHVYYFVGRQRDDSPPTYNGYIGLSITVATIQAKRRLLPVALPALHEWRQPLRP